jgi:fused signal recognition particle receptor
MGLATMFQKITSGLTKTRESVFGKVQSLLRSKSTIDDDLLNQIEEILLAGDVGVSTTDRLIENITRRVKAEGYQSPNELGRLLQDEVASVLGNGEAKEHPDVVGSQKPYVIMVVGVNGAGKTTTLGKLAYRFRQNGKRVVIGAADTFRAAAREQLEVWTERAGAEVVHQAPGADPASVAFDTLSSAMARGADVVLIDTAGRLHTKVNLMEELKKIRRVLDKKMPGSPHEILLVLDAGTGQNGLQQVKQFSDAVGVTGIVLTKLDGTAKGGIVLAIANEMKIPVRYIGVGEQLDDLQPFDRRAFVEALFGDVAAN